MFYCTPCAKDKGWPTTEFRSKGRCEVCSKPNQLCNEVKSRNLGRQVDNPNPKP